MHEREIHLQSLVHILSSFDAMLTAHFLAQRAELSIGETVSALCLGIEKGVLVRQSLRKKSLDAGLFIFGISGKQKA